MSMSEVHDLGKSGVVRPIRGIVDPTSFVSCHDFTDQGALSGTNIAPRYSTRLIGLVQILLFLNLTPLTFDDGGQGVPVFLHDFCGAELDE